MTYSDRNSSTGSELSELAIHTLLVEARAKDLDRELHQDPDSDCYLLRSETVFDNAADDLETIAVSKRSMNCCRRKKWSGLLFNPSDKRQSHWRKFGA